MISKEKKAAIMAEYGRTPNDTGSPEVQIAILTARIQELTEHLKENPKEPGIFFDNKSLVQFLKDWQEIGRASCRERV